MNPIIPYIEENGIERLTYNEFIQLALYHPDFGYYMKGDKKIGKDGDYYTSASMSAVFGEVIAKWFLAQVNEEVIPSVVLEVGAGDGSFAQAFIRQWEQLTSRQLDYILVDESPYHRALQKERLSHVKQTKLDFYQSLEECPAISGLIFSNELLDALPVHIVEKKADQLFEVMITAEQNKLKEVFIPLANEEIIAYMAQMSVSLYNGQRIEIPLFMTHLSGLISTRLTNGLVLTADYGYPDQALLMPARKEGSLRGYRKHQLLHSVLTNPGDMDITHDVHWDSWIRYGEDNGLAFRRKWRQDEFLIAAGILDELANHHGDIFSKEAQKNRAIRTLLMNSGISQSFQLVLQQKEAR